MKRVLTLTLVLLLMAVPVFAATGDIYKSDGTPFMSAIEFLTNREAIEAYINKPENFLTEIDGLLYKADDIKKAFEKDQGNYIEALKKSGAGIPKIGAELKVVDFKLSAKGTFAEVSLSREAKLEELSKIVVKPEGTFERVEGKTAIFKFNEKLADGQEVEIGGISKKFKMVETRNKVRFGADPKPFKVEFIGGELEKDSFMNTWFLHYEDSFKIKNNSDKALQVFSSGPNDFKETILSGKESKPLSFENDEALNLRTLNSTPDKANTKFERAEPARNEGTLSSVGKTDKRCRMPANTVVVVKMMVDSTEIMLFEKTYEAKDDLGEFARDLEALRFRGKWIFKDFVQIPGVVSNPPAVTGKETEIKFKINEEVFEYKPVLFVEANDNTSDDFIAGDVVAVDDNWKSKPAKITFDNGGWESGAQFCVFKVVIKENNTTIFEGILETSIVNGIKAEEWGALNTNPKIKFSGSYSGASNTIKIEFDSEFKGDLSIDFEKP